MNKLILAVLDNLDNNGFQGLMSAEEEIEAYFNVFRDDLEFLDFSFEDYSKVTDVDLKNVQCKLDELIELKNEKI